jgi:IS30 family transposase
MKYRTHKANITEEESKEIKKLYDAGMQRVDIARKFNRACATIYYHTWSQ